MAFPGWDPKPVRKVYEPRPAITPERQREYDEATKAHFEALLKLEVGSPAYIEQARAHDKWMRVNGFAIRNRGLVDTRNKHG